MILIKLFIVQYKKKENTQHNPVLKDNTYT